MTNKPPSVSKKNKQHECYDILIECGLDPEIATFYLGLSMLNNKDPMHFIFEAISTYKMYMEQDPQEEGDQIVFTFDNKIYH